MRAISGIIYSTWHVFIGSPQCEVTSHATAFSMLVCLSEIE